MHEAAGPSKRKAGPAGHQHSRANLACELAGRRHMREVSSCQPVHSRSKDLNAEGLRSIWCTRLRSPSGPAPCEHHSPNASSSGALLVPETGAGRGSSG